MEDASSLNISLEALIYTLVVDANEGQDVAIFNVPGTYWYTGIPDKKYVGIKL